MVKWLSPTVRRTTKPPYAAPVGSDQLVVTVRPRRRVAGIARVPMAHAGKIGRVPPRKRGEQVESCSQPIETLITSNATSNAQARREAAARKADAQGRVGFSPVTYADAQYWDRYFSELRESGDDLDWGGLWTEPFLAPLREVAACTVLDLGCGTGNDAARLAGEGYAVTALDYSAEAIELARARVGTSVEFLVADMARPLPFPDASFDAVMSNVALHMFPDRVTRSVFAEIGRLVRPGGLFLFHVNSLEDRPLRARWRPDPRELEPNYVLESGGQTMHFFSDGYLRDLLRDWSQVRLEPVVIPDRETGEPFKHVWRGVARR